MRFEKFPRRGFQIVVVQDVLVFAAPRQFRLGRFQPAGDACFRLRFPSPQPLLIQAPRRQGDEDGQVVRIQPPHLLRPLHVDLQHHVVAAGHFEGLPAPAARRRQPIVERRTWIAQGSDTGLLRYPLSCAGQREFPA